MPAAPTSPDSEHARFYLFNAASRFIKKVARSKPLVLVLDDLHWADKPSLLLLEHVAHEIRDSRMLLIGTYREAKARQAGPLAEAIASLSRESRRVPLGGLGEGLDSAAATARPARRRSARGSTSPWRSSRRSSASPRTTRPSAAASR